MHTKRRNHDFIQQSLNRPLVTAIIGPRRIGKSTFVQTYAQQYSERTWVHLNMDVLQQKLDIEQGKLETLIIEQAQRHIGDGEKIWVSIDEAQKAPSLFEQIKALYDRYKDHNKIKFIVTGSAVLNLHQLSAESLAGRVDLIHLQEFSLRESADLLHKRVLPEARLLDHLQNPLNTLEPLLHSYLPHQPVLTQTLETLLVWGGFPEVLQQEDAASKTRYLHNYLQTYLEKDVLAINTVSDLNLYHNLMQLLAEQTGSPRDDSKLKQALGCHLATLQKYRGFLSATLLYQDIYPHIYSSLKRLAKSPKGYLLNNGLISILTGLSDLPTLIKTGLVGHRFENWFLNELHTWQARQAAPSAIHFWRTSDGREVDFIVKHQGQVIPFELTHQNTPDRKKERNLLTFLNDEPKATNGFIVYRGPFMVKGPIVYLPAWAI